MALRVVLFFILFFPQYYQLRYRCDSCEFSYNHYRTIIDFNQTSFNLTVSRGELYTASISSRTSYGSGRSVETAVAVAPVAIGPVTNLAVTIVNSSMVLLTWGAPQKTDQFVLKVNSAPIEIVRAKGTLMPALISRFFNMKRLGVFLGILVHRSLLPSILSGCPQSWFPFLHLGGERHSVRVKCFAEEHNVGAPANARTLD